MSSKLLLLAITIFVSQNSLAETKIKMASTNEYDNYLFKDIKKIKPNVYRFWMEVIYKEDMYQEDIYKQRKLVRKKGEYERDLNEIDCNQKTRKLISSTRYNEDGIVINSFTNSGDQIEVKYIVPNSYGEQHMKQVCKLANKT